MKWVWLSWEWILTVLGVDLSGSSPLGVDLAVLGVDLAVWGVDLPGCLGVDLAVLGVDSGCPGSGSACSGRRSVCFGSLAVNSDLRVNSGAVAVNLAILR